MVWVDNAKFITCMYDLFTFFFARAGKGEGASQNISSSIPNGKYSFETHESPGFSYGMMMMMAGLP